MGVDPERHVQGWRARAARLAQRIWPALLAHSLLRRRIDPPSQRDLVGNTAHEARIRRAAPAIPPIGCLPCENLIAKNLESILMLEPLMSLREAGKSRRRQRILRAARRLIESGGFESFSIKAVAESAELSVATLYNLFGSKEAILIALLVESIQSFEERLDALAPATPIERITAISDLAVGEFTSAERFYRPLLSLVEQMGSRAQLLGVIRRCVDLGEASLRWAIETGDLRAVVEPRVLSHQIFMAFVHSLRMWSSGLASARLFEAQVLHFRTLMLAGVASEPLREELHRRLEELNASMLELVDFGTDRFDQPRRGAPRALEKGAGA